MSTDPLALPPPTGLMLCDYSSDEGWAIKPRDDDRTNHRGASE